MKIIDLQDNEIEKVPGTEGLIKEAAKGFAAGAAGGAAISMIINGLASTYFLNSAIKKIKDNATVTNVTKDQLKVVEKTFRNKKTMMDFENAMQKVMASKFGGEGKLKNAFMTAMQNIFVPSFRILSLKDDKEMTKIFMGKAKIGNIKLLKRLLEQEYNKIKNNPDDNSNIFKKYFKAEANSVSAVAAILTDVANEALNEVEALKELPVPVAFVVTRDLVNVLVVTPKLKLIEASNESEELALLFSNEALESADEMTAIYEMYKEAGFEKAQDIYDIITGKKSAFESTDDYDEILPEVAIESINEIIEEEGTEGLIKWIKDKANTIKKRRRLIDISEEEKNKFAESALEKFKPIVKSVAKEVDIELPEPKIEWKSNGNMLQLSLEGSNLANEKLETLQKIAKAIEDKTSQELPKLDPVDYWQFESDKSGCFLYYSGNFKRNK